VHRALRAGAAAAAVPLLLASGCGDTRTDEAPATGHWTRAAEPPLSARYGPLLASTGTEVLVLGGHTGPACPPGADCTIISDLAHDGAAYDPETDHWRPVSAPPLDLDQFTTHVMAGARLVVGDHRDWWSYDAGRDAWSPLPEPARGSSGPEATDGQLVYTHAGTRVQVLDLADESWSELPPDPLEPRLTDGAVFATDAGVVLTGVNYDEAAPDEPTLTQADVWDGTSWRRLPRTGMIGPLYHWTGRRLVGAEVGGADGGQVNGWDRWYPSAGALDPRAGEWTTLPGVPGYDDLDQQAWRVEAASGPRIATAGFVYDDDQGTWTGLGHPRSVIREDTTGVWAGDRLVVVGGSDGELQPVSEAWVWAP
jgi:hypothetical protein